MKNEEVVKKIESIILEKEKRLAEGDSSKDRKLYVKLVKIYAEYIKDSENKGEILDPLMASEEPAVALTGAAYALSLGYRIGEAEDIILQISKKKDLGIVSFNAEMTLKVWKEQGFLKF